MWRETSHRLKPTTQTTFQSTPSVWRETRLHLLQGIRQRISIHSLRVEGDRLPATRHGRAFRFQSTPSVWRETALFQLGCSFCGHFNPLPPCGGRRMEVLPNYHTHNFNPLPPCGGRRKNAPLRSRTQSISIHSLRVEGDCNSPTVNAADVVFQSTPSVWRETRCDARMLASGAISIHSLRVEGDNCTFRQYHQCCISIHSLRVEGDLTAINYAGDGK